MIHRSLRKCEIYVIDNTSSETPGWGSEMASGSFADFRSIKTMNYFCATGDYFTEIMTVWKTSHRYIKLHKSTQNIFLNITWHFPQIKTVTFWLISHMKFIAKMTEDPNSAVMHEIMCVQINTYFDTIFKNPWFLNGAPTFWNSGGVQGLSEPLLLNPTANPGWHACFVCVLWLSSCLNWA